MPVLGRALRKGLTVVADERLRLSNLLTAGVATTAGVKVSPANAMTAAAVYASVSLIAQTMAELPIHFLRAADATRVPVTPPAVRALWTQPNPDQSLPGFIETAILSLLLWGNLYVFVRRDGAGNVAELWPIDPDRVSEIERLDDDGLLGLRFRVDDFGWVTNRPGEPVEMLHVPWLTLPGRIKGISPVAFHAELIGMSLSAQEHATRFLGDGAHLAGVLEVAGKLGQEEANELLEGFNLVHAGPKRAGRTGVLAGGATYKPIAIPPNELQFLEQMQYSDQKIATIYRVPPHMVGDVEKSTSWGTGIEEQTKGFVVYTLVPIAKKIERAVEDMLLPGAETEMRFQLNGLLRGSVSDRAEFYRVMHTLGAINADEMRAFEDLPPIGGEHGGRFYVPLNIVPADAPPEDLESRFRAAAAAGDLGPAIPPREGE